MSNYCHFRVKACRIERMSIPDTSGLKFFIAEHRQAYASWCGRNGVKQNHAVFVSSADTLLGRRISPEQVTFVDGWERSRRRTEILAAYAASALL